MNDYRLLYLETSLALVFGPTTPSAVRPLCRWKALTAFLVLLPKMPSTFPAN